MSRKILKLIVHLNLVSFATRRIKVFLFQPLTDLVQREAVITNDEHVGIIPVPGTCELAESVL